MTIFPLAEESATRDFADISAVIWLGAPANPLLEAGILGTVHRERNPNPGLDLPGLCEVADRMLDLVREWDPQQRPPVVNDWNDQILVLAFARAYRCLRSIRLVAGSGDADDTAVLTRALIALTLRYLWLGRAGEADRDDRLQRLRRKWVTERATLGEELEDLNYLPAGTAADFRATADELREAGVPGMPGDKAIALQLDEELQPEVPRFFELLYARIYRTTSENAHYGLGTLLAGLDTPPVGEQRMVAIDRRDDAGAAEALGLALITFAALANFVEPIVPHGQSERFAELIEEHRRRFREPEGA